jgi:hypothetical protein
MTKDFQSLDPSSILGSGILENIMVSPSAVYWAMQCDSILNGVAIILTIVSVLAIAYTAMVSTLLLEDNLPDALAYIWVLVLILLIAITLVFAFIPNSKTVAAMYVVPYLHEQDNLSPQTELLRQKLLSELQE